MGDSLEILDVGTKLFYNNLAPPNAKSEAFVHAEIIFQNIFYTNPVYSPSPTQEKPIDTGINFVYHVFLMGFFTYNVNLKIDALPSLSEKKKQ